MKRVEYFLPGDYDTIIQEVEPIDICQVHDFDKVCVYILEQQRWIKYKECLPTVVKKLNALAIVLDDTSDVSIMENYNAVNMTRQRYGMITLLAVMWILPGKPVPLKRIKELFYEKQGSPPWLLYHPVEFLTSTRVAEICDSTVGGSQRPFWLFLMRLAPSKDLSATSTKMILNHGTINEDVSRNQTMKMLNCVIEDVGTFVDLDYNGMACNVDGVIRDPITKEVLGIVEIKNPINSMYNKLKFDHIIQMQQNMRITGTPWCYYIVTHFPNECQDIEYHESKKRKRVNDPTDKIKNTLKRPPSEICYQQYCKLWLLQEKKKGRIHTSVPKNAKIGMIRIVKLYASPEIQKWILDSVFNWWNKHVLTFEEPPIDSKGLLGDHTHPELFKTLKYEVIVDYEVFVVT